MKSSAYLYKLLDNGVVRRDLPQASPVSSYVTQLDTVEAAAHAARLDSSARNFSILATLRPAQPQQPKIVSSAERRIATMLRTTPLTNATGVFAAIYDELFKRLPDN